MQFLLFSSTNWNLEFAYQIAYEIDYPRWPIEILNLCVKYAYQMNVQNWWIKLNAWKLKRDFLSDFLSKKNWSQNWMLTRTTRWWMMIEKVRFAEWTNMMDDKYLIRLCT